MIARNLSPRPPPPPRRHLIPSPIFSQLTKLRDGNQRDPGFGPLNRDLARLASMIGSGDGRPASQLVDAVRQSCETLAQRYSALKELSGSAGSLNQANIFLRDHHLDP